MGSNPAVYWMDVSNTYSMKKEIKVAKWGTPKKIFKKSRLALDKLIT
jgi:hypothetical protein